MIYLDNGATSFPKAPGVSEAISRFLAEEAANPGRSGHAMAKAAEGLLDRVRLKLARLVNAPGGPDSVAFGMNGTDALNMAIKGVLEAPTRAALKPTVITTVLEHNSVSRPLQAYADHGQINLVRIGCDATGLVDMDALTAELPGAFLVVMTHASNVLGTIQPAAEVGALCREHDVLFLLDAAQTVGALQVDMQALNVDLLAFPGHKSLLGPTGTGALVLGERVLQKLPLTEVVSSAYSAEDVRLWPFREGGTGGDSKTPLQPAQLPFFLEGGTPNTVGLAGLEAGIDYVLKEGIDKILAHEQALVQRMLDALADDDRFVLYGTADASGRMGVVSLNAPEMFPNPFDLGMILDDAFQIAVRPGLHCSPYCHKAIGTFPDGTLRVTPGPFNTEEEIDTLLSAMREILG